MFNSIISVLFIIFCISTRINSIPLRPIHTADCSHGYCYFSNLNLTKVTYFDVRSNIPASDVIFVSLGGGLDGSKIHTLTNQICEAFPNVEEISASNLGLSRIQPNAFVACKNLQRLDLTGNNLKTLSFDIFATPNQLKELSVSNNQLTNVDEVWLVRKFKSLESFRMCPNDKMKTNRLFNIAKYLQQHNIEFSEFDNC